MQRSILVCVSFVLMSVGGNVATAQTPFVDGYYGPDDPTNPMPEIGITSYGWIDLPFTQKTLTLPSGTAVITWSGLGSVHTNDPNAGGGTTGFIRPVIGQTAPNQGMTYYFKSSSDFGNTFAGSWSTPIAGGATIVGLQASDDTGGPHGVPGTYAVFGGTPSNQQNRITWNIIVFPQATGGAPAVSNAGIVVMLGISIVAGSIILLRRATRAS
jgi:hypothetical protein